MTLKTKLISSIIAFIIVMSLMLVGVMATQTATIHMGGNVSFTASDVYAQVTGSIVGTADYPTGSPLKLTTIDIDYTDTEEQITMPNDWTQMPLTFDENGSEITVSVTITNRAVGRNIRITLTDTTQATGFSVSRECNGTTFSKTDTRVIEDSATYTFKLNVSSRNNPASGTFGLDVKLENTTEGSQTGYTVTINGTRPNELSDYIKIAINNDQSFSIPRNIGLYNNISSSNWTLVIENVNRIAFGNGNSSFTDSESIWFEDPFTAQVISSDGRINAEHLFTGNQDDTSYMGWYEITNDVTITITITSEISGPELS